MAEARDPLTVADEAVDANIMGIDITNNGVVLRTRNGEGIQGTFVNDFLTDEQIRELIAAVRALPGGGNAFQQFRIAADGTTVEPFTPENPQNGTWRVGDNLLNAPILPNRTGEFPVTGLSLDGTVYALRFGTELHIIIGNEQPNSLNGGSFVLEPTSIVITNGFDTQLDSINQILGSGITGPTGPTGKGVPAGGTAKQVLTKNSDTDFDTGWQDNTSDTHIRSLADEQIAQHEMDNTHPDDGLNQGQVDSRVTFGTKEFARRNGRSITASDTDFANRINPDPSGQGEKFIRVKADGTGYEITDAPSGLPPNAPPGSILGVNTTGRYWFPNAISTETLSRDINALVSANNRRPNSIWTDGVTMYIADNIFTSTIFAYNIVLRTRDESKDIDLRSAGVPASSRNPVSGLWSDGTTMWINVRGFLYAVTLSTKQLDSTKSFIVSGGGDIWSDGTTVWAAPRSNSGLVVRAYTLATRQADTSKDFNFSGDSVFTTASNANPSKLTSDGTTIWFNNSVGSGRLYAYNLVTKAKDSSKDIVVANSTNINIAGLYVNNNIMWVVDSNLDKVFAYNLDGTVSVETKQVLNASGSSGWSENLIAPYAGGLSTVDLSVPQGSTLDSVYVVTEFSDTTGPTSLIHQNSGLLVAPSLTGIFLSGNEARNVIYRARIEITNTEASSQINASLRPINSRNRVVAVYKRSKK